VQKLQNLEARWNAILGLEAAIDMFRQRVEGARAELEAASTRALTTEEKLHALQADVAQLNKAKSRAHYALPKARDFIHRATWALGTPERKELGELFKDGIRPDLPLPQLDKLPDLLEQMLKNRQGLSAQGGTVCQECVGVTAEIQRALTTLQSNAAANAQRKRLANLKKGKFV
jgi:hypothetical protein